MDVLYEELHDALTQEVGRQEAMLEAARAQGEAVRARSIALMDEHSAALTRFAGEMAQAETARKRVMAQIAARSGLASSPERLNDIVEIAPQVWRERLKTLQRRLREVVTETRNVVFSNAVVLRASLKVVRDTMREFELCGADSAVGYSATGLEPATAEQEPRLINQRG